VLATKSSYYKLVLVAFNEEIRDKRNKNRGFKFEASWWVDEERRDVIQQAWGDHGSDCNPIHSVRNKLDHCQSVLIGWSRRKFGNT
jgi:hypothetical protein